MSWSYPPTDEDREWMRRFPGSHAGPFYKDRRCWVCGEPGYTVPWAPPLVAAIEAVETPIESLTIRTGNTCAGHEWITRRFLSEHPEYDRLTWSK